MKLADLQRIFSRPEALIFIMNDLPSKQVLVAWTLCYPEFKDSPVRSNESPRGAIERYWEEVNPDIDRLAAIAGIPVTKTKKIFDRLRAAYLVWPNGTVDGDALSIVVGERNAYIRSLMAKQPQEKGNSNVGKRTDTKDAPADRNNPRVKAVSEAVRKPSGRARGRASR